jgi:hypothetical protein
VVQALKITSDLVAEVNPHHFEGNPVRLAQSYACRSPGALKQLSESHHKKETTRY